jgi:MFS family permease
MVVAAGGTMVLFPLFPSLQASLGLSTGSLGLVAAAGFGTALVTELLLAPQADRGHVRRMAVIALALVAASLAASALATEAWHLVAARAVSGVGLGLYLPAAAGLLVRLAPRRAGEALGRLGTAELGGLAVGPLLASAALTWTDPATVFAAAALLTAVGAVVVGVRLREPAADDSAPVPPALAFDLLRSRRVLGAVVLAVAVYVPIGAYDAVWPRYLADLDASALLIGLSYALFALPFMVVAAPAGRLADRVGGGATFARGIVVLVVLIAAYGVIRDPWVATGAGLVESGAQAFAAVGAAAAMAQAVPPSRAGAAQGLARAAGLLAATVTSAVSGFGYAVGGPLLLFGATAVLVVLVALVAVPLLRTRRPLSRGAVTPRGGPAGSPVGPPRAPAGAAAGRPPRGRRA